MAQYQINVDSQLLHQLFLGNTQDSGVAKLLESVLNQILQAQVTEQLEAQLYERTENRQGYRNGSLFNVGNFILYFFSAGNGQTAPL
ncbi:hypothetical protein JCM16163A_44040 [Paenibacillus sp. YK5]